MIIRIVGLLLAALASLAPFLAEAQSQTFRYQVLIDSDRSPATGCAVIPTGGASLAGFEHRLQVTVEVTAGSAAVTALQRSDCSGASFGAPVSAAGPFPWPVGLNAGTAGADVIELAVPLAEIAPPSATALRMVFVADDGVGSDVLATVDGSAGGAAIEFGLPAAPVANARSVTTRRDTSATITLSASDPNGDPLTFAIATPPGDGSLGAITPLTATTAEVVYSPAPGFTGTDSFTFIANDGALDSLPATITISVAAGDVGAVAIPFLGGGGMLLLVAVVVLLGLFAVRRLGRVAALSSLMLVAGLAWAMNFTLDGQVGDWAGMAAIGQDPTGDATDGNPGNDLVAAFAGLENGNLYLRIDVVEVENGAVNAVPDAYVVNEDTVLTIAASGVLANDTGAAPLTAVLDSGPSNAASFVLNADGSFTYTPNADFNGSDSFSYTATDGSLVSPPATVTLTVTPVNDAPSFSAGSDVSSDEDAGAQTVSNWATAISAGPADESGQALVFNLVSNSNPSLFLAGPAIDAATGTLTYTAAADANGTASIGVALSDNGGTANGGDDTSPTASFTLTINPVDDLPTAVADGATVNEDAAATSISVLVNDTNADGGPISIVSVTQPGNGTVVIIGGGTGLTYQPAANYCNGGAPTDDFSYTLNGGSSATVAMTVICINDPPGFTAAGNVNSNEDAGPQTVSNWATAISAGPANESGQALGFSVTSNSNPALFAAGPAVNATTGALTYTAAANANGTATLGVVLVDDGGTANGGSDTSAIASFTITINPVADPPTAVDDSATVLEDAAATAVDVLANDIQVDAGPITIASATQPTNGTVVITGGGTGLTYQPDPNYCNDGSPTDTFTYTLNGGSSASVAMTVTCVNDAPTVTNSTISYSAIGNTLLRVPGDDGQHAGGVPGRIASSADASNAAAKAIPADVDAGDSPTFQAGTLVTTQGGSITIDTDGDFHYLPPVGFTGADSVVINVTDGVDTTPVTVQFTVGTLVWYVEDTVDAQKNPAGGPGTSTDAFETLAAAEAASGTGDIILVMETDAPLGEGIALKSGQKLYGQRIEDIDPGLMPAGFIWEAISDTNARPQIHRGSGVTITVDATAASLGTVEIRHLDLQSGDDDAIEVTTAGANTVSPTIDENVIGAAGVRGIDINGGHSAGTMTVVLTDNTVSSTDDGVHVAQSDTGTTHLSIGAHTLTASAGDGIELNGSGGPLRVVSMGNITVPGTSSGRGLVASAVIFDANPADADFTGDTVSAGALAIGSSGDPVGASGVVLLSVSGDLAFADLDLYATTTAMVATGNGVLNAGAGTGFRIASVSGSNVSGTAGLTLNDLSAAMTLSSVVSSNGPALDINGSFAQLDVTALSCVSASGCVDLTSFAAGSSTAISGAGLTCTGGTCFNGSGAQSVTVTGASNVITATGGTGLALTGSTVGGAGLAFQSVNASGGTNGIVLDTVASGGGNVTIASVGIQGTTGTGIQLTNNSVPVSINGGAIGSVSTTAGTAFAVNQGAASVTLLANITNTSGRAVEVTNRTGGTVTVGGTITGTGDLGILLQGNNAGTPVINFAGNVALTSSGSGSAAVSASNNAGATINFGDLDINNSAIDSTALSVSGTGTFTTTSGTLHGGTAPAVDIDNSGLNVALTSVSSVGGSLPGIDLVSTTGSFSVIGDGVNTALGGNGSGGSITGKTTGANGVATANTGVRLDNAENVGLQRMILSNHANWALHGTSVNGLVLRYTLISGTNGDDAGTDEGSVYLINPTGSLLAGSHPTRFDNVNVEGGLEDNVRLDLSSGTLPDFRITNSRIGLNSNALGNDGVLISTSGSATGTFVIDNNAFVGARGDMFQLDSADNSAATLTLSNNQAQNTHTNIVPGGGGITISGGAVGGSPTLTYTISNNVITDASGPALSINKGSGGGTWSGTVSGNTIGVAGNASRGSTQASGLRVVSNGSGRLTADIQGNSIYGYNEHGVTAAVRDGSSKLELTLQGNTIANPGAFAIHGIYVEAGPLVTDTVEACVTLGGAGALANSFVGSNGGFDQDFRIRQRNNSAVNVIGYAGASTDSAAVIGFVQGLNTGTPSGRVDIVNGIGGTCSP